LRIKHTKSKLTVLSFFIVACSCKQLIESKTERAGEPDVFNVSESNNEMKVAIEEARNNIHLFKEALKSDNPNFEYFAIKQKFTGVENDEHIWIGDITIEKENFIGVISNVPIYDKKVKLGDTITIDNEKISDWLYYENGIVRGGYTIRVIRESLPKDEREIFDYENGLIFDN